MQTIVEIVVHSIFCLHARTRLLKKKHLIQTSIKKVVHQINEKALYSRHFY